MTKDKKQIVILATLVVVILAVGAFQFMAPAPAPATPYVRSDAAEPDDLEGSEEGAAGTDEEAVLVDENGNPVPKLNAAGQQMVALAPRDPFQVPGSEAVVDTPPTPPVIAPPINSAPRVSVPRGNDPYVPPISGTLPGGSFSGSGPVAVVESTPNYKVMGVIIGEKPMAVFEDDKGNQRLVPLGGSVDGDTTVTKIEKGKVTLRHRGKDKTLVIQEEARNEN